MNKENKPILVSAGGAVARITLNRPDAYNALSAELIAALHAQLNEIASNSAIRVVVIAAQGRAFSAGHDLKDIAAMPAEASAYAALFKQCSALMLRIQSLPQPVIAQVQGIATAAGCQLVAACDLAVAGESARFATSGINLGLFCATPSVPLMRNMPRKHAMRMLLTGDFISAQAAAQWGLINECVADEALSATVDALAAKLCAQAPQALALGKQLVYQQANLGEAAAYTLAGQVMARNMALECAQTGMAGFVNKTKTN